MDEKTRHLVDQLKGRPMNFSDSQMAGVIRETRSEALADLQSAQSRINSTESKEEVRQEIETIRKKITG